jgi:hypothetical protein
MPVSTLRFHAGAICPITGERPTIPQSAADSLNSRNRAVLEIIQTPGRPTLICRHAACRRSRIVNCREVVEHIGDHVDGNLSAMQRWRLRLNLWICGNCRKYLRSYKTTVRAEKAAFCDASDDLRPVPTEELVQSILSAANGTRQEGGTPGINAEPPSKQESPD